MHKGFLKGGALLLMLSVILGAFGAHALKQIVPESALAIFETAVRYQVYHSFALLITGILFKEFPRGSIRRAGLFFIIGILLFSGSLYGLTFIKANNLKSLEWIGILTPIGGLFFIAGWFCLFLGIGSREPLIKK